VLLQGNAAMARGALEAGVRFCAAYPGSPSSEIVEILIGKAADHELHVEWSSNEKVAFEAASAAALCGLRALAVMKANGLNVALDALTGMALAGCRGLVVLVSDDPAGHSSTNELDSRHLARHAGLPLLVPADFQQAKDLLPQAFDLSEACQLPVLLRASTRLCHARGTVRLGPIPAPDRQACWTPDSRIFTHPPLRQHQLQRQRLERARQWCRAADLDRYQGPTNPENLLLCAGSGWLYGVEAVQELGLQERVGVLGVVCGHPLPQDDLWARLQGVRQVGFLEETDPVLEQAVLALAGARASQRPPPAWFGKRNGAVTGELGPGVGEIDPDTARELLERMLPEARAEETRAQAQPDQLNLPERPLAFCPGCPHKASFFILRRAISLDARGAVVMGDIGCYSLAFGPAGFGVLDTVTVMGGGAGQACGLGQLTRFGFSRPVLAVMGDSTFFHSGLPPLVSARYNGAAFLFVLLDNCATAMTGFQPHPGTGRTAQGRQVEPLLPESLLQGLDIPTRVLDPFEIQAGVQALCEELARPGLRAVIFRRECALSRARSGRAYSARVQVDAQRCLGDDCGCALTCLRHFSCPALRLDEQRRAAIDPALCVGCQSCVRICPAGAIQVEEAQP